MHRKGAITGRVLDENGVGIEGVPVVAYRAHLASARGGRKGRRTIGASIAFTGWTQGNIGCETTAHTLDDGSGVLPTFGPQSREVREARAHDA